MYKIIKEPHNSPNTQLLHFYVLP